MTTPRPATEQTTRLRLWPGVAAVTLQWFLWLIVPLMPFAMAGLVGIGGGLLCGILVMGWWLFFSRAPWLERLGMLAVIPLAFLATSRLVHPSIAGGMMGNMLFIYSIPPLCLGLAAGAVIGSRVPNGMRSVSIALSIVLASLTLTLIRTDGVLGAGSQIAWRWTPTAEERLLAMGNDDPKPPPPAAAPAEIAREPVVSPGANAPSDATAPKPRTTLERPPTGHTADEAAVATPAVVEKTPEWPGFRGPDRDSVIRGVRIETDWTRLAPVELWRRPIGPGWSSFAISGDLIYTQEQRGDEEIVAAYKRSTGEPVWRHRDPVRFYESNGGAGPRATPTLGNGRVYSFGATGILNALDAATGAVVWSKDVASETAMEVPEWGFTSSPLVVDDVVIVAADARLAGYDAATGRQRWVGPVHHGSYSSPHPLTIDGVVQVVLIGGGGAISVAPADGSVLWEHAWRGTAIVQPAVTADGNILVNTINGMGGNGVRRLAPVHASTGWTVEERWTSTGLKPYFNDFVVHKAHAFGFDGSILACIDLQDGKRVWKGGRYGNGQLVLLPDEDLLLVLSEEGELALVSATPDQFKEIARFPVLEGKTWNHPVLVGDTLFVRNGQEMAAFRLSLAQ
jgi:outer membrane protein assembly factor BamB